MSDERDENDWELINSKGLCGDTCRLRVVGGWLYRVRECADRDGRTTAVALTFVPNPTLYRTREPR
jgi:hypothetical protein